MGNAISLVYDVSDNLYQNYYPKQKWLQPRYVGPSLMGASVAYLMITQRDVPKDCVCDKLVYVLSAGASLGLQLWISFVSPTTFWVLPRHTFGKLQAHLFPKYFFLTTLWSYASLASFLRMNPISGWKGDTLTLGAMLVSGFVLNTLNVTCFGVGSIKYNLKMHEIEKSVGEGIETVGKLVQSSQLEINPDYTKVKRSFLRFHAYSFTTNVLSFACTLGQFWFLSRDLTGVIGLCYSIDAYLKNNPAI